MAGRGGVDSAARLSRCDVGRGRLGALCMDETDELLGFLRRDGVDVGQYTIKRERLGPNEVRRIVGGVGTGSILLSF